MRFENLDTLANHLNGLLDDDTGYEKEHTFNYLVLLLQLCRIDIEHIDLNKVQVHLTNFTQQKSKHTLQICEQIQTVLMKIDHFFEDTTAITSVVEQHKLNVNKRVISGHRSISAIEGSVDLDEIKHSIESFSCGPDTSMTSLVLWMKKYIKVAMIQGDFKQLKLAVHYFHIANAIANKYLFDAVPSKMLAGIEVQYIQFRVESLFSLKSGSGDEMALADKLSVLSNIDTLYPNLRYNSGWMFKQLNQSIEELASQLKHFSIADIEAALDISNSIIKSLIYYIDNKSDVDTSFYNSVEDCRENLSALRRKISNELDENNLEKMSDILRLYTANMVVMVNQIATKIVAIIGEPPCKYFIGSLGSMSREEMCLFSDFEFFIVAEKYSPEIEQYFRTFVGLLEIYIILLGETPNKLWEHLGLSSPRGFRLDDGFNIPFNGKILFGTIDKILSNFRVQAGAVPDIILSNAIMESGHIMGDSKLYDEFCNALKRVINQNNPDDPKICIKHSLLSELLINYTQDYQFSSEQNIVDVKAHLTRLIVFGIGCIAQYKGLQERNTWKKITALVERKIISDKVGHLLICALNLGFFTRMGVHRFYNVDKESLSMSKGGEGNRSSDDVTAAPLESNRMLIDSLQRTVLVAFNQYLIEFEQQKTTANIDGNDLFKSSADFYSKLARQASQACHYTQAATYYLAALALDNKHEAANYFADCIEKILTRREFDQAVEKRIKKVSSTRAAYLPMIKGSSSASEITQVKLKNLLRVWREKLLENELLENISELLIPIRTKTLFYEIIDIIKNVIPKISSEIDLIPRSDGFRFGSADSSDSIFIQPDSSDGETVKVYSNPTVRKRKIPYDVYVFCATQASTQYTKSAISSRMNVVSDIETIKHSFITSLMAEFIIGYQIKPVLMDVDDKPVLFSNSPECRSFGPMMNTRMKSVTFESRSFSLIVLFCLSTLSYCSKLEQILWREKKGKRGLFEIRPQSYDSLLMLSENSTFQYKNILFAFPMMCENLDKRAVAEFLRLSPHKVITRLEDHVRTCLFPLIPDDEKFKVSFMKMKNFYLNQMIKMQQLLRQYPVLTHIDLVSLVIPQFGSNCTNLFEKSSQSSMQSRIEMMRSEKLPNDFFNSNTTSEPEIISPDIRQITAMLYRGDFSQFQKLSPRIQEHVIASLRWDLMQEAFPANVLPAQNHEVSFMNMLLGIKTKLSELDFRGFSQISVDWLIKLSKKQPLLKRLSCDLKLVPKDLKSIISSYRTLEKLDFSPEMVKDFSYLISNFPAYFTTDNVNPLLSFFVSEYYQRTSSKLELLNKSLPENDVYVASRVFCQLELLETFIIRNNVRTSSGCKVPAFSIEKPSSFPKLVTFYVGGVSMSHASIKNLFLSLETGYMLKEFSIDNSLSHDSSHVYMEYNFSRFFRHKIFSVFSIQNVALSVTSELSLLSNLMLQKNVTKLGLADLSFSTEAGIPPLCEIVKKNIDTLNSLLLSGHNLTTDIVNAILRFCKNQSKLNDITLKSEVLVVNTALIEHLKLFLETPSLKQMHISSSQFSNSDVNVIIRNVRIIIQDTPKNGFRKYSFNSLTISNDDIKITLSRENPNKEFQQTECAIEKPATASTHRSNALLGNVRSSSPSHSVRNYLRVGRHSHSNPPSQVYRSSAVSAEQRKTTKSSDLLTLKISPS